MGGRLEMILSALILGCAIFFGLEGVANGLLAVSIALKEIAHK